MAKATTARSSRVASGRSSLELELSAAFTFVDFGGEAGDDASFRIEAEGPLAGNWKWRLGWRRNDDDENAFAVALRFYPRWQ